MVLWSDESLLRFEICGIGDDHSSAISSTSGLPFGVYEKNVGVYGANIENLYLRHDCKEYYLLGWSNNWIIMDAFMALRSLTAMNLLATFERRSKPFGLRAAKGIYEIRVVLLPILIVIEVDWSLVLILMGWWMVRWWTIIVVLSCAFEPGVIGKSFLQVK